MPRQRGILLPGIKSAEEIKKMEKAGRIVAETLSLLKKYIQPGTRTIELDKIAEDYIRSHNAEPAFKGYQVDKLFFPNTLCISIDEEVVHGIPSDRQLKEGEIVSIDCGAVIEGYYGDSAVTYAVGEIDDEKKRLMQATEEALMLGIEQAVARNKIYDISRAIQEHVESRGFSVTRELVGHGIGKTMHEEPPVPNFVPPLLHRQQYPNVKLAPGMAICIEPMVHAGRKEIISLDDGWTVITRDRKPAAHFEHQVVIGEKEALILTLRD
ncbi:MAG: type I methionyl aminopeptidase [Candidatus Kapaibacterium sp.]